MQLSLVSHYGEKPVPLQELIADIQALLLRDLDTAFRPYQMEQVHGTITGIETEREQSELYSKWYLENKGCRLPMDLKGLSHFLGKEVPRFLIKIGGYQPDRDYGFTSRGQHPFHRSFSLQGTIAVAMGWPGEQAGGHWTYGMDLYALRAAFEKYHLCHKWNKGGYQDNDFFFVLGKLDRDAVDPAQLKLTAAAVRQLLMDRVEFITVGPNSLSLVAYDDTELPLDTTQVFPLVGADVELERLFKL